MRKETTGNQCYGLVMGIGAIMLFNAYIVTWHWPFNLMIFIIGMIPFWGLTAWSIVLYGDEKRSRIIQGIEFFKEDTVPVNLKCRMVKHG
jgi:hypothetical protein